MTFPYFSPPPHTKPDSQKTTPAPRRPAESWVLGRPVLPPGKQEIRPQPHSLPPGKPTQSTHHGHHPGEVDSDRSIWRDTALRYAGYADEVGEFLGPYLGGLGKIAGYGISSLYVLADLGTTLPQKYQHASAELSGWQKAKKTGAEALDLSLFHYVATLLVPPMLIGKGAHWVDQHLTSDNSRYGRWVQQSPNLNRWTHSKKTWANDRLKPKLANIAGHFARWLIPLETFAQKVPPEKLKRVPIFGELLANLPKDVEALRNLKDFQFDEKNMIRLLVQKPIPVAVGVGLVPLIAHPFDMLMLKIQDWTIRPLLGKNKLVKNEQGRWTSMKNDTFWGRYPKHKPPLPQPAPPMRSGYADPVRLRPFLASTRFGVYPVPAQPQLLGPYRV